MPRFKYNHTRSLYTYAREEIIIQLKKSLASLP